MFSFLSFILYGNKKIMSCRPNHLKEKTNKLGGTLVSFQPLTPLNLTPYTDISQLDKRHMEDLYKRVGKNIFARLASSNHASSDASDGDKNPYHMEGDVATHTAMVKSQMEILVKNLPSRFAIQGVESAYGHDLGKPDTREEVVVNNMKKVRFFSHASWGVPRYLELEDNTGMTDSEYYEVLLAIALHLESMQNIYQKNPTKNVLTKWKNILSYNSGLQVLLPIINRADDYGRIALDRKFDEKNIPKGYTILSRLLEKEEESQDIENDILNTLNKPAVIMLSGLPASGKSTFVQNIIDSYGEKNVYQYNLDKFIHEVAREHGLTYRDAFKTHQSGKNPILEIANERLNKDFSKKMSGDDLPQIVLFDRTNLNVKSRKKAFAIWEQIVRQNSKRNAFLRNYKIFCNVFYAPLDVISQRNENREDHTVENNVMLDMVGRIMPPLYGEISDSLFGKKTYDGIFFNILTSGGNVRKGAYNPSKINKNLIKDVLENTA